MGKNRDNRLYKKIQNYIYQHLEAKPYSIPNLLIYLLIFISIVATFIGLIPYFRKGSPKQILFHLNLVIGTVFLVEYCLRVWICTLSPKYKKQGRLKYILSPMAIIDFFASVPVVFLWADVFGILNAANFGFSRILRLARFLRALKFGRLKKIQKQIFEHPVLISLIASILFIFYSSVEVYYADELATHGTNADFWNFFRNLFIVFTGEYAFDPESFSGKLYTLLVYVIGLLFGGVVLGRLVSFFSAIDRYDKVPDGLSDHIVIFNWTSSTDAIIRKLHDKVVVGKRDIVVISDNKEINKDILYLNSEYDFVYFLNASPFSGQALEKANITEAKSLVLLSDENNILNVKPLDFNVKILLTVKSILNDRENSPHIICEVIDKNVNSQIFQKEHLERAGADEVVSRKSMNNLLAQSAINPKIPEVFKEFLTVSDATNEIYLKELPENPRHFFVSEKFSSFFNEDACDKNNGLLDDFGECFIPIGITPGDEGSKSVRERDGMDISGLNPNSNSKIPFSNNIPPQEKENSKLIMISYEEPVFNPDSQEKIKIKIVLFFSAMCKIVKQIFTSKSPENSNIAEIGVSGDILRNYIVLASEEDFKYISDESLKENDRCKEDEDKAVYIMKEVYKGRENNENVYFVSYATYKQLRKELSKKDNIENNNSLYYYEIRQDEGKKWEQAIHKFALSENSISELAIFKDSCVIMLTDDSNSQYTKSNMFDEEKAFIAKDLKEKFNVARITAEVGTPDNAPILNAFGVDTTICSTDYTNGIIALCAMEGGLYKIFDSLLKISEDTNEFYIYSLNKDKLDWKISFRELQIEIYNKVQDGQFDKRVILIGYIDKNGKIIINPHNQNEENILTDEKVDSLILIAYNSPERFLENFLGKNGKNISNL